MVTIERTLTQKGQVTIPAVVRARLKLKPGDRVRFVMHGDIVEIRAAPSAVASGYGAVRPLRRPEDFRALREAFETGVADDVAAEG